MAPFLCSVRPADPSSYFCQSEYLTRTSKKAACLVVGLARPGATWECPVLKSLRLLQRQSLPLSEAERGGDLDLHPPPRIHGQDISRCQIFPQPPCDM